MMKYFTLDDWISHQNIETVDMEKIHQTDKEYKGYLASITDKLPPDLVRFYQTIRIHDAGLLNLELDVEHKQAVFTVDTYPTNDNNGLDRLLIELQYDEVRSLDSTSNPQKGLAGPFGYGDIGGDEIEMLAEGIFEHRFLFSSGIELAIQFGGFTMRGVAE